MAIRLNKVTRDFNVGLSTIVDFLQKKGFSVEENPNTKISDEAYELLIKEFSKDKDTQLESVIIDKKQPLKNEEKSEASEKIFKIEVPIIESHIKVIGKIDLDTINQTIRSKKKSEEGKTSRKCIRPKQIIFSEEKDPIFVGDISSFKKWYSYGSVSIILFEIQSTYR
jgi:translation initiation factor IF-2